MPADVSMFNHGPSNDPADAIQKAIALKKMQASLQQLGQGQPYGQTGQPTNVAPPVNQEMDTIANNNGSPQP